MAHQRKCATGGCTNPAEFIAQENLGGVPVNKELCAAHWLQHVNCYTGIAAM